MTRFEYQTVAAAESNNIAEPKAFHQFLEMLAEFGRGGWELCGFYNGRAFFKRSFPGPVDPKQSGSPAEKPPQENP